MRSGAGRGREAAASRPRSAKSSPSVVVPKPILAEATHARPIRNQIWPHRLRFGRSEADAGGAEPELFTRRFSNSTGHMPIKMFLLVSSVRTCRIVFSSRRRSIPSHLSMRKETAPTLPLGGYKMYIMMLKLARTDIGSDSWTSLLHASICLHGVSFGPCLCSRVGCRQEAERIWSLPRHCWCRG